MSKDENIIRVVSAVADKTKVILYKEDGDTIIMNQGDHRLKALLDEIIPITTQGKVAVVSLEKFSVYADFEKKTNGLVRLFRVGKAKLSNWIKGRDPQEVTLPEEAPSPQPVAKAASVEAPSEKAVDASVEAYRQPPVADLVPDLEPIDEKDTVGSEEAVVAIVGEPGKERVIPDVDKIKPLIEHAARTNSTTAVENFLKRLAAIIDKRRHSVEDLMRFLEKGDLPLAEDGSIIAYKILRKKEGHYVDCHTGLVPQRVGSYVCVDEKLVDLERDNECSNGLHIARRGYIGQFSGDICTLCKIDPEDVMVVPHNDANKIRVKGYHILAELSQGAYQHLRSNKPMTTELDSLRVVFEAIKGNHIGRIERVQINGQHGKNVVVTQLEAAVKAQPTFNTAKPEGLHRAAAIDDEVNAGTSVEPRDINKQINDLHAERELSESEQESGIEDDEDDGDIPNTCDKCGADIEEHESHCEDCLEELTAPDDVPNEAEQVSQEDLEAAAEFHDKVVETPAPLKLESPKLSRKDEAALLLRAYNEAKTSDVANKAAQALVAFKKDAKVGWEKLGIAQSVADLVLKVAAGEPKAIVSPATADLSAKLGGNTKNLKVAKTPKGKGKGLKELMDEAEKSPPTNTISKLVGKAPKVNKVRAAYEAWLVKQNKTTADDLKAAKKGAKKGWEALGFTPEEVRIITNKLDL